MNGIRRCRLCLSSLGTLSLLVLAGCSKHESRAYGVVKLDNETLDHGTVKFSPIAPGPAAYAMIDDDGRFELQTGRDRGLTSGTYRVTVTCTERTAETWAGPGPPPPGKPIVPVWYNDPGHSGLQFEVKPGNNEINLTLTREPPAGMQAPSGKRRVR